MSKEMGGDHTIITAPGAGTTVRATVPLVATLPDPRPAPSSVRPLVSREVR